MSYLVDTNILARLADPTHVQYETARDAVELLKFQGHTLHVVPQNLYEFWVVSTRPAAVNGMGRSPVVATAGMADIKTFFNFLSDTPAVFTTWERLVTTTPVIGKNAHDARLVAAMIVHGLTHLLTFNAQDFRPYTAITAVTPAELLVP
jgi:predicted nucleic acid-binding protein